MSKVVEASIAVQVVVLTHGLSGLSLGRQLADILVFDGFVENCLVGAEGGQIGEDDVSCFFLEVTVDDVDAEGSLLRKGLFLEGNCRIGRAVEFKI